METLSFKNVLKNNISKLTITLVILIVLQFIGLVIPILISNLSEIKELRQGLNIGLYLILLLILEPILKLIYGISSRSLQSSITKEIQNFILNLILKMKLSNFKNSNNFLKIISEDPKIIGSSIVMIITSSISEIFKIMILLKISSIHWIFGVIYLIGIICIIFLDNFCSKFIKESKRKAKKNDETVNYILINSLSGIKEIKSFNFNIKEYLLKKLTANNNVHLKKDFIKEFFIEIKNILLTIITLISIIIGGFLIIYYGLHVSKILLIFLYKEKIFSIVKDISEIKNSKIDLALCKERIYNLSNNEKFPKNIFGNKDLNLAKGKIEFKNVTYGIDKEKPIIKNISLEIKPKSIVAFVGHSGCGKTSLLNLIMNYESINSGSLKLDDLEVKDITENSLRENISMVQQAPIIFNISFKNNLLLAKPNASDEEIHHACKLACIDDLIDALPKKYNSIIGKDIVLSGGQKQRLAIARALLKKSSILLMDEATSALDSITQQKVMNSVKRSNKTILIVAHRLSTIKDCDKIFVMAKGKLVSSGSHNYLIKHSSEYRKVYNAEKIK